MNEEADIVSMIMISLRIPEHVQRRVLEYYEELIEGKFVKNPEMYKLLSTNMTEFIKLYQIKESVKGLSFIDHTNLQQIEKFAACTSISFYLPGDIIIRQGEQNSKLYYVHEGIVEVIQHDVDFLYFDHREVEDFLSDHNLKDRNGISPKDSNIKEHDSIEKGVSFHENIADRSDVNLKGKITRIPTLDYEDMSDIRQTTLISDNNLIRKNSDPIDDVLSPQMGKKYSKQSYDLPGENSLGLKKSPSKAGSIQLGNFHRADTINSRTTHKWQSTRNQANLNYTVINELSKSNHFGEISVLTNLPVTATIHVVSTTIC